MIVLEAGQRYVSNDKFNVGDKYTVKHKGEDPFYWNFEHPADWVDEHVVAKVVPAIDATSYNEEQIDKENNVWNNSVYGELVALEYKGVTQWLPKEEVKNKVE